MCGGSSKPKRFFLLREQGKTPSIEDMFSRLFQDDQSELQLSKKMTMATFSFLAKPTWQERHVGPHCQYSIDNKKSKTSFWSKSMEKLMIDSELRVSIMESSQKRKFF